MECFHVVRRLTTLHDRSPQAEATFAPRTSVVVLLPPAKKPRPENSWHRGANHYNSKTHNPLSELTFLQSESPKPRKSPFARRVTFAEDPF